VAVFATSRPHWRPALIDSGRSDIGIRWQAMILIDAITLLQLARWRWTRRSSIRGSRIASSGFTAVWFDGFVTSAWGLEPWGVSQFALAFGENTGVLSRPCQRHLGGKTSGRLGKGCVLRVRVDVRVSIDASAPHRCARHVAWVCGSRVLRFRKAALINGARTDSSDVWPHVPFPPLAEQGIFSAESYPQAWVENTRSSSLSSGFTDAMGRGRIF
jgi:hypothetical protein